MLKRLNLPFSAVSPDIDESYKEGETPIEQTRRLAIAKAHAVSVQEPNALIIGSDQLAELNGCIIGKPGYHEKAKEQLWQMRGQCVRFQTGLCLLNSATGYCQVDCLSYDVFFREYSADEIERYLVAEQPYHCAGSFKSEKLGISLVTRMEGTDATALIGLPLIRLCNMLANEGVLIP